MDNTRGTCAALECAQALGDSRRAWRLVPADVDQLRERGHGDWVQALTSLP